MRHLQTLFSNTAELFSHDKSLIDQLWNELETAYSSSKRHYHTLSHLDNMLRLAHENRTDIADWETFVFAIFYHDAVYNVLKKDNEARSAALASKRLTQLGFPTQRIELCQNWIRATQKHELSDDPTCNLLLDIDLSVLSADWEIYLEYTRQVRREYGIYPDLIFIPGRRKVLEHFLQQDHIYKTPDFRAQSEARARENLQRELQLI